MASIREGWVEAGKQVQRGHRERNWDDYCQNFLLSCRFRLTRKLISFCIILQGSVCYLLHIISNAYCRPYNAV